MPEIIGQEGRQVAEAETSSSSCLEIMQDLKVLRTEDSTHLKELTVNPEPAIRVGETVFEGTSPSVDLLERWQPVCKRAHHGSQLQKPCIFGYFWRRSIRGHNL